MNEQRKLILGKEPFIRKADNPNYGTQIVMRDFMIALLPLILFAWIKNGLLPFIKGDTNSVWTMLYPLIFIFIGGFTSMLVEFVYYKFLMKDKNIKERMQTSFAAIPGLLLAMILSVNTPLWVLVFGCLFATLVGKLLFGGFGNNVFNPALIGYLFLTAAYYSVITSGNGFLNPSEIIAGATPMTILKEDPIGNVAVLINQYGLGKMFLGLVPGAIAETSSLLCLVALVWLIVRKVVNWRIPVFYLGSVFALTYIIGAFNGYAASLDFALTGLFSGGLMFGAVFMATEPVTSPRTPNGKIIFGLGLGVLTVLFRFKSNMPEGVASAILVMNLFTIIIDRLAARLRISGSVKKMIIQYSIIGLILVGISAYSVSGFTKQEVTIDLSEQTQNFDTLNFDYTFTVDDETVIVTVDETYAIVSVSVAEYDTDEFKVQFQTLINSNKITVYVTEVVATATETTVSVSSKGFGVNIPVVIVFDLTGEITAVTANTTGESYFDEYNEGWTEANGHPDALIPGRIINGQSDLSGVEVISGATVTSRAIIGAATVAMNYMEAQNG
jgi:electron transport complex protein RnfD